MLTKLNKMIKSATEAFDGYEYAKAKSEIDQFFWKTLCDNYLEIIKDRMYNPGNYKEGKSGAQYTVQKTLISILKLFAPIMPYVTEELYHGLQKKDKSIHTSEWPKYVASEVNDDAEKAGDLLVEIVSAVRKFKSEKGISLKTDLKKLIIEVPDSKVLKFMIQDIKATTRALDVEFGKGDISVTHEIKLSILI
ncbi:MAG TPA: class I tRNA ligase family protein [Candidatus Nanoarchaeia archaeon]|nr:class I tRNA ligase family protein [Candidatus Nanoarchaeia archaeon]